MLPPPTVHQLSIVKQPKILNFSLFLKNSLNTKLNNTTLENSSSVEITYQQTPSTFQFSFRQFLQNIEKEPLGIDTNIFDEDRKKRAVELFNYEFIFS